MSVVDGGISWKMKVELMQGADADNTLSLAASGMSW